MQCVFSWRVNRESVKVITCMIVWREEVGNSKF